MKLIDEKGRLFGKINLIDLLVVILIVAVIAAVAWKLGGRKAAAAVTGSAKKAVYTVEIEDVPADIAAYAETQTGKSLVNDSKVIAASITDVRSETYNADNGHQTLFITVEADDPSPATSTRSGRRRCAWAMNTSSRRASLS